MPEPADLIAAIDAGDADGVTALLAADPELANARERTGSAPCSTPDTGSTAR